MKYQFFAFVWLSFFVALSGILIRGVLINPADKTLLMFAATIIPFYLHFVMKGFKKINRLKRMDSGGSWE